MQYLGSNTVSIKAADYNFYNSTLFQSTTRMMNLLCMYIAVYKHIRTYVHTCMHAYVRMYLAMCLHTINVTYFLVGLALVEDTDE